MKKVYTAAFKAQVALDLLKEEKSLAQISAEYGVHANVLRKWRTQARTPAATYFAAPTAGRRSTTTPSCQSFAVLQARKCGRKSVLQTEPPYITFLASLTNAL